MTEQELRDRFNPDGSQLRKAQLRMLELLMFIDKVCSENDIKYWLDAGTLLGAKRHGGFIPWDDDADICMPKEELKKFQNVFFEKYADSSYVLQCEDTDPGALCPWVVLRDLKSEYLQDSDLHKKGVIEDFRWIFFPWRMIFIRVCMLGPHIL
jgi:lipopolysaccharide cholinephosphotransferase